jgi:hypothetical protein
MKLNAMLDDSDVLKKSDALLRASACLSFAAATFTLNVAVPVNPFG